MASAFSISAEEWELLSFFEVEPTKLDPEITWPYNSFTYRRAVGDVVVTFSVDPARKDFTLIVERAGVTEIKFWALSVFDIRYQRDSAGEWLEIHLVEGQPLQMRLAPSFGLSGRLPTVA